MKSGIYCFVSKINGKRYIGSSNNVYRRNIEHRCMLKNNRHFNTHLQRHVKKYGGVSCLDWIILELCELSELNEREIYWVKFYNSHKKGFNATAGGKIIGTSPIEQKRYDFINIDTQELFENKTVIELTEKINKRQTGSSIYNMVRGKHYQVYRWTIKGREKPPPKGNIKSVTLKNASTGEMHTTPTVTEMSIFLNCCIPLISGVIQGYRLFCKGWCLPETDPLMRETCSRQKKHTIKNTETGETISFYNRLKVAKSLGVDPSGLCKLVNKKRKQLKGWILLD